MPNENDTTTYSVELSAAPESREDRIAAAKKLAKEIGADAKKVFQLISSAPKTISRSMSREDAEAMAGLCRDAGLEVSLVAAEPEIERWAPATKVVRQAQQGSAPRGRTQTRTQTEPQAASAASVSDVPRSPERSASSSSASQASSSAEREDGVSVSFGGMRSSSPYVTILFAPRRTMRYVLDTNFGPSAAVIVIMISLTASLPFVLLEGTITAPVPAIIGSLMTLYVYGFLYAFFGQRFFGGQAGYHDARMAYAWGLIPGVWMSLAVLIVTLLTVFIGVIGASALVPLLLVTINILFFVGGVWSLVGQSQAVGEAHRFSGWRGFGTIVASALIPSLLIVALVLFILSAL